MELTNIFEIVNFNNILLALLAFFVFSYLLLALFNLSFMKPFKYMGICLIVVGCYLLIIRFTLPIVVPALSTFKVPNTFVNVFLKPCLIYGFGSIIIGILFIIIQNLYYKNKKVEAE